MKKTPILLSTVILAASGIGVALPTIGVGFTGRGASAVARGDVSLEKTGMFDGDLLVNAGNSRLLRAGTLGSDPLVKAGVLGATRSVDRLYLDNNAQGSAFSLLAVNYKRNQIGMQVKENGDWRIRRVVGAYWDYENGATEANAVAELGTLGVEESATWRKLWDYDAGGETSLYHYTEPIVGYETRLLAENLTDIVYFAVEYGHKTDAGWQDIWWERGKIDYRGCVHSSVFDPETMFCQQGKDGAYGASWIMDFSAVNMPTETVVSWDEEWREVQRQRYKEAMGEIEGLQYSLNNGMAILDGADKTLEKLEVTLPKTTGMSDVEAEVERLKMLSQQVRKDYANMSSMETQKEIVRLQREKVELETAKERAEQERVEIEAAKLRIEQENVNLRQKIEKLTLAAGENRGEGANGGVDEVVVMADEAVGTEVAASQTEVEVPQAEVEVPNLGKTGGEANRVGWLVAATGVATLTAAGLGVARVLRRRK